MVPRTGHKSAVRALRQAAAAAWLAICLAAGGPARAETLSGEVGGYRYRLFVPDTGVAGTPLPLLVALHGCRQSAEKFARLSRFDDLAGALNFAVLYPETGASADNPHGCWRWWAPENQLRTGGEPEIIVDMVDEAASALSVDRQRVYVVGLSSGGAMSAILGALYPDVFAAVGVHSGLPYGAATSTACALEAMSDGAPGPESGGTIAYHAQGTNHRVMPLIVVQGSSDSVVSADNAALLVRQYAQLNDLADDGDGDNDSVDAAPDTERTIEVANVRRYQIRGYNDAKGREILREVVVDGLGHAWSGGAPEEDYADANGPDASSLFLNFFSGRTLADAPLTARSVDSCRERFGANFTHYWWHRRMSREEYRCDPWGWTWRRGYGSEWSAGRCP